MKRCIVALVALLISSLAFAQTDPAPTDAELRTEAINRLAAVLEMIFQIPPQAELSALWLLGFSMPMVCYMAAFGVGALVNFWRK